MESNVVIVDRTAVLDGTLNKVYAVLGEHGVEKPVELVSALLSAGILFRERIPK